MNERDWFMNVVMRGMKNLDKDIQSKERQESSVEDGMGVLLLLVMYVVGIGS